MITIYANSIKCQENEVTKFDEREKGIIINAMFAAAVEFKSIAERVKCSTIDTDSVLAFNERNRLSDQFEKQASDTQALADELSEKWGF